MYTTITVKQILDNKGYAVWSISANAKVYEALQMMADKNIGALLVVEDSRPVGIFSERDYARRLVLEGKNEHDTHVREVMTDRVIAIKLDQKIEACLALMTGKYIRHLPVVDDDKKIVGIISIGDVVKEMTAEQTFIIDQLVQYIAGESRKPHVPEKLGVDI
jgi:signal-transduction protein with cAMP-binding, CBS, and nucleotidyltransferase domain